MGVGYRYSKNLAAELVKLVREVLELRRLAANNCSVLRWAAAYTKFVLKGLYVNFLKILP